ncbi:hypothetical protein EVAR_76488_1 [Eumeta japonica]|uniref:Uncharacterized protein n=1 Tax=Eumeta variegata TaxID=151549 RepID=A0A4C1T4J9_EUMVA|nr:hypothetical protein EVAR_76488_1 [Eumeta japonica]
MRPRSATAAMPLAIPLNTNDGKRALGSYHLAEQSIRDGPGQKLPIWRVLNPLTGHLGGIDSSPPAKYHINGVIHQRKRLALLERADKKH